MDRVEMIPFHECWEWIGSKLPSGYGTMTVGGRTRYAHAVAKYLFDGVTLGTTNRMIHWDHKCNNTSCVNPKHIVLTSAKANVLRGNSLSSRRARQKKCSKGHEFSMRLWNGRQRRLCLVCRKEYMDKYNAGYSR